MVKLKVYAFNNSVWIPYCPYQEGGTRMSCGTCKPKKAKSVTKKTVVKKKTKKSK
jgi:hypothetical protein